jgi:hypothetical protein
MPPTPSPSLPVQMLQKAGWESGKGLGSEGQGIKAPVNRGPVTANNLGVGVAVPEEVVKEDTEFDQYRKRMMLAYKVRILSLLFVRVVIHTHTHTHTHTHCSTFLCHKFALNSRASAQ